VRHALIPLVLVAGGFAACSSEQSSPDSASSSSSSGGASSSGQASSTSSSGGGADSGKVYPAAKGDPCRGIEIPTDQHYVPAGMCARLVATNVGSIRQITFAPNGDLWGAAGGSIYRMRDADDDGFYAASEIVKYGDTNAVVANSVHLDIAGGYVYSGSAGGVVRFPYSETAANGGTAEVVVSNQPGGGHGTHTAHVYDGYLYVQSGSEDNASVTGPASPYDTTRSIIKRFPLASFQKGTPFNWTSSGEIVSSGLRNTNGFTRHAASGKIFGVVNGLDGQAYKGVDVHNDNPGEQVVEIAMGKNYGYPFCFTVQAVEREGAVLAPGTQLVNATLESGIPKDDDWCATNSLPPATFIQAHSAPLDITFFEDHPTGGIPEKYRGGAFVALHGSWNRAPNTGYKVIWIPFDASGKAPMPTTAKVGEELVTTFPYETVFGGNSGTAPLDGEWGWTGDPYGDAQVRPSGVAVGTIDGALYIAADKGGKIYRVGVKK
jgi:glucose/arabinose dehydrogenase